MVPKLGGADTDNREGLVHLEPGARADVADFEKEGLHDEDVLGFDIAVGDVGVLEGYKGIEEHVQNFDQVGRRKVLLLILELLQVLGEAHFAFLHEDVCNVGLLSEFVLFHGFADHIVVDGDDELISAEILKRLDFVFNFGNVTHDD